MNGAAVLAISLLVAAPLASESLVVLQPSARLPATIPFELANRHVIVRCRVNSSRPLSFVLDTGANTAIVRMATAMELGLALEGSVNTGGAGAGTQAGRLVKGASWSLDGLEGFSQRVSLALPLPELPPGLGQDVDGIIGGEFIQQFVLALDYQARTITFHDPRTFRYGGTGQPLPLEFSPNRHPIVPATVTPRGGKPIEHRFMLDIGSGAALVLHSPFVTEHALGGPPHSTVRAIGGVGAGGRVSGRIGRVEALQIGGFTLRAPNAMFAEDKAGAFADRTLAGNIGAQIASRFRIVLDYSRRRLILEPSLTFSDPFDRAISGLALRAEGPEYRTFRVREVLEDSAATEAGIQAGDVITAIDGTDAAGLTLTAINEMLENATARALVIRRGDATVNARITPRRLP
jgi:hypothetical protein